MADQMSPLALPFYGHRVTRAPHMAALAEEGVVFDAAYCNSPLCAPSRSAFLTGRLPSRIGAFDNASEFPASVPTLAHAMRLGGYRSILAGKMHFCGPDQLHGFEERLTTDIYPSDFGWTPDWENPQADKTWFHSMTSVLEAGPCLRTNQLDYDDEVVFAAERKLFEMARGRDERPFFMVVSLTHPHDPFVIGEEHWNRYEDGEIDLPRRLPSVDVDPHTRRLRAMCATDVAPPDADRIRAARRAYYGAISYVDDQFGRLRRALRSTGQDRDTVIVIVSDHGEMLGERGLWYKMTFFEGSARVPLIVHAPDRVAPHRVRESVSLVDVLPTLLDLAGLAPMPTPIDGRSLLPHLEGRPGHDEALGEYLAEGALAPIVMIRRGRYKFIHSRPDPDQLYDLSSDPDETVNLARDASFDEIVRELRNEVAERWDLAALSRAIVESQRCRRLVDAALSTGRRTAWDHQPIHDASRQYVRSHMDLEDIEAMARFPRPIAAAQAPPVHPDTEAVT
jgi:choline-sulfatase